MTQTQAKERRATQAREVANLWFMGLGLKAIAERKGIPREQASLRLKQAGVGLVAVNTLPIGSTIAIIDKSDGRVFARGVVADKFDRWPKHVVLDINEYQPVPPTRISGNAIIDIVRNGRGKLSATRVKEARNEQGQQASPRSQHP